MHYQEKICTLIFNSSGRFTLMCFVFLLNVYTLLLFKSSRKIFFRFIYYITFCTSALVASLYCTTCVPVACGSEEGVGSPKTGVIDSCESSRGHRELNPGLL